MRLKGIDQKDIAAAVNVSTATVSDWCNGKKYPRVDAMQRLSDFLGVYMSDLISETRNSDGYISHAGNNAYNPVGMHLGMFSDHAAPSSIRVPVLGSIPAGIPMEAIQDILDWEEIPAEWARGGKEYFALKVSGDSMYPRYEAGDVIIVHKQDTCESGQDCVVMVNGDDATFKRVKLMDNGLMLQPINPSYDPLVFTAAQVASLPVRILGVAVQLRRDV